jgi:hypothetical protein
VLVLDSCPAIARQRGTFPWTTLLPHPADPRGRMDESIPNSMSHSLTICPSLNHMPKFSIACPKPEPHVICQPDTMFLNHMPPCPLPQRHVPSLKTCLLPQPHVPFSQQHVPIRSGMPHSSSACPIPQPHVSFLNCMSHYQPHVPFLNHMSHSSNACHLSQQHVATLHHTSASICSLLSNPGHTQDIYVPVLRTGVLAQFKATSPVMLLS